MTVEAKLAKADVANLLKENVKLKEEKIRLIRFYLNKIYHLLMHYNVSLISIVKTPLCGVSKVQHYNVSLISIVKTSLCGVSKVQHYNSFKNAK